MACTRSIRVSLRSHQLIPFSVRSKTNRTHEDYEFHKNLLSRALTPKIEHESFFFFKNGKKRFHYLWSCYKDRRTGQSPVRDPNPRLGRSQLRTPNETKLTPIETKLTPIGTKSRSQYSVIKPLYYRDRNNIKKQRTKQANKISLLLRFLNFNTPMCAKNKVLVFCFFFSKLR